jgi:putative transposase
MEVPRTEAIWMGPNETFGHLAHLSKNLWNQANYIIRQEMFAVGRMVGFRELRESLKNSPNYKGLPAQTAQYTLLMVEAAWYAYHKAHNDWKIHPEKYLAEPRFPKYKAKDGQYIVGFTNQQSKLKDGVFKVLPKLLCLNVKTRLSNGTKITGARIIPKGVGYQFEITYEKEVKIKKKMVKICCRCLSIIRKCGLSS